MRKLIIGIIVGGLSGALLVWSYYPLGWPVSKLGPTGYVCFRIDDKGDRYTDYYRGRANWSANQSR